MTYPLKEILYPNMLSYTPVNIVISTKWSNMEKQSGAQIWLTGAEREV